MWHAPEFETEQCPPVEKENVHPNYVLVGLPETKNLDEMFPPRYMAWKKRKLDAGVRSTDFTPLPYVSFFKVPEVVPLDCFWPGLDLYDFGNGVWKVVRRAFGPRKAAPLCVALGDAAEPQSV